MKILFLLVVLLISVTILIHSQEPTNAGIPDANRVLVVYNSNSDTSFMVANYYKNVRNIPSSNIVPLPLPDSIDITTDDTVMHWVGIRQGSDIIRDLNNYYTGYWTPTFHAWKYYLTYISTPIREWITTHNLASTIRYIVLCKGVPFKVQAVGYGGSAGTSYGNVTVDGLLCILNTDDYDNFIENSVYLHKKSNPYYNADPNFTLEHRFLPDHYITDEYNLSYLVSHLDGISYDIVKEIIDKSIEPDTSGIAAWVIDDDPTMSGTSGYSVYNNAKYKLESLGFNVVHNNYNNWITSHSGNVMGYASWGTHAEDGNEFWNDSAWVKDSLHFNLSNGSVFNTNESFNGNSLSTLKWHYVVHDPPNWNHTQGLATQFTQIGGTATMGHAWEPGLTGVVDNSIFFPAYAIGYNLIDAVYQGVPDLAHQNVVVGDPLLRIGHSCEPMIISSNTTINSGDYDCSIIVPVGKTLTIAYSSTINFNRNANLKVYGNLIIEDQVTMNFNYFSMLRVFEGGNIAVQTGSDINFNDVSILENRGTLIFNTNSNLTMNDNSKFNSSGKLKFLPGVNIVDNSSGVIKITGSLFAQGLFDNYVDFNFTPSDPLYFTDGDTLKLNYCSFNHGSLNISTSSDNAKLLLIENSNFNISSITISNQNQLAINVNAKLNNVQIENFIGAGIYSIGLNSIEIDNCHFISSNQNRIGIELRDNNNSIIENSIFTTPYGVVRGGRVDENNRIFNSENISITNCVFNYNPPLEGLSSTGISLINSDINVASLSVEYCNISGYNTGIGLLNLQSLEPYIINNAITNFKLFGISATVGNSIRILDNNISSSDDIVSSAKTGIFISDISNPILFRNTIQLTSLNEIEGAGIGLFSSNGEIRANTISGFKNGIELGSSSPNIGSNTITNNQNYGIYIGPDSYPDLSATYINEDRYPLTGYNTIRENGLCSFFPGYSEIYLSSSFALLKGGCNTIADDRYDPSLQCNHNYLIDGDHVAETIDATRNYWGEANHHNPEGRFGENISVNYDGYLQSPCLYSRGSKLLLLTDTQGEVFDSVYSDAVMPTDLTEIESKYAEANEFYYTKQFTQAKQKFSEIIQIYGNDRLSLQAYMRLLEIAGLDNYSSEQFLQLKDFYIQKAGAQSDSLITSSLIHLSDLCLVSGKEYIPAINNFEEIAQQNPNTDLALYRQIDALTTSLLLTTDSTLGKMVPDKYKINDISAYTKMISDLLRTRGKEGLESGKEVIPISYCLYQNYPNPFNPVTTIKFDIPDVGTGLALSNVTLKVYDVLGAEVATLVNEEKLAGKYEVNFNASRFASGVYIYKIQAGSFINSKKMLLLK